MRIVHVAAGAGPMYCGACARDASLVRGLVQRGCDVTLIPLYTPLKLDHGPDLAFTPVFLGGINAYLQQLSPAFGRLPARIKRWLDRPGLLTWASQFGVRTQPKDLGPMTVSVLQGPNGRQAAELSELMAFLDRQPRPELFAITNSLLSGIAPELKRRYGVPIVCHLQGEESFVAGLPTGHREDAAKLIAANAESIDLFLATCEANRRAATDQLGIPLNRTDILRPGIDVGAFESVQRTAAHTPTVGFLSSILPSKGLDLLVSAFTRLAREDRWNGLRLRIAGRNLSPGYLASQRERLRQAGLSGRVAFEGELGFEEKKSFFASIDVMALPSRIAESRGIAVLEALACGCPVVVPNHGIFPEIVGETCGGVLFGAGDEEHLAVQIAGLLSDRNRLATMGNAGSHHVRAKFGADQMVDVAIGHYQRAVARAGKA